MFNRLVRLGILLSLCGVIAADKNQACPKRCNCQKNFTIVDCHNRRYTDVPKDIPPSVVKLDLSHNDLGHLKNDSFPRNLLNLNELHLDVSQITGFEAHAFRGLTNLRMLFMFGNQVKSIHAQTFCSDLPNIKSVYMDRNLLDTIPDLSNCSLLTTLTLENNHLENAKFPKDYEKSKTLQRLTLSLNKIHRIRKDDLTPLRNARISLLLLSRNNLEVIEDGALDSIAKTLLTLKLSFNPLNSTKLKPIIEQLTRCPNLKSLSLDGVQFNSHLPPDLFGAMKNSPLTSLSLNDNQIASIQTGTFANLDKLQQLQISGSKLESIEPTVFRGMYNLSLLDLSRNSLKEVPANLPYSLRDIRLQHNLITNIRDDELSTLSQLTSLNLQKNSIQELGGQAFGGLKNLKTLDLSMNSISHIPRTTLSPLRNLHKLDLSQNKLSKIIKNVRVFEQLHKLTDLDLSKNDCDVLPYMVFQNLTNLRTLNLAKNYLKFMLSHDKYGGTFAGLMNLKSLWLDNNDLNDLSPGVFRHLTNLENLYMSHNRLSLWDEQVFTYIQKLKHLDLSLNKISVIDQFALGKNLSNYNSIDLQGNPFACGCDLVWFLGWVSHTKVNIIKYSNYTCDSPKSTQGLKLENFNWHRLVCFDIYPYVIAGSVLGGIIVLTFIVAIMYRCRWRLSLCCYRVKQRFTLEENYQILEEDREYDAYISYDERDTDFVENNIVKLFDQDESGKFHLCYQNRDFQPGRSTIASICDAIEGSHRAIVVITNHYLATRRYQMELDVLHDTSLKKSFSLIFVTYDQNLNPGLLPKWLHKAYRNGRFIEWNEDASAKEEFDSKLDRRLRTCTPVRDEADDTVANA